MEDIRYLDFSAVYNNAIDEELDVYTSFPVYEDGKLVWVSAAELYVGEFDTCAICGSLLEDDDGRSHFYEYYGTLYRRCEFLLPCNLCSNCATRLLEDAMKQYMDAFLKL